MNRAVRLVVLLAILGGLAVAAWVIYKQPAEQPADSNPQLRSNEGRNPPPRPEEKVGVTTESVGGG